MRLFCRVAIETADIESMEAPTETWCERGPCTDPRVKEMGMRPKQGEKSRNRSMWSWDHQARGVILVIVDCTSKTDRVEDAVDIVLQKIVIEELNEGEYLEISFGEMKEGCLNRREEMRLEVRVARRELRALNSARRMSKFFRELQEQENGDAKMHWKRGRGQSWVAISVGCRT